MAQQGDEAMSEWKRCSESLPPIKKGDNDISESVLAFTREFIYAGEMFQAFYSHLDEAWYFESGDMVDDGAVSHWCELPPPPAEGE